jgi:hypothetical protein
MQESKDFEVPTVNGRPLLATEDIKKWTRAACGKFPSTDSAERLATKINYCDFLEALWKDRSEFKSWRENHPSLQRMQRIAKALAVLKIDLKTLTEDLIKIPPNFLRADSSALILNTLESVDRLAPMFERFRRGAGRRRVGWHGVVRELKPLVLDVIMSTGASRAGFGQPTSPAVVIMQCALKRLGVSTSEDAIVDAVRQRAKPGKSTS